MTPDEIAGLTRRVQDSVNQGETSISVKCIELAWLISRCEEVQSEHFQPKRGMKDLPKLLFACRARQRNSEGMWQASVYSSEDKSLVYRCALAFEEYRDKGVMEVPVKSKKNPRMKKAPRSEKPVLYEAALDWMVLDPSMGTKTDVDLLKPLWEVE